MSDLNRSLSVAPMMDWTDCHCRYFHRLLSSNALLYTEMVTTGALIHGDKQRFLAFSVEEQPLALQLGGSDPDEMARCAKLAQQAGYVEVNINVGCPSDRVQNGRIGACLMSEPVLVAQCISEMRANVDIPVTVKTRIGIDNFDSPEFLFKFVEEVSHAGCETVILHARKAILTGLSPKENRTIPPLNYERAYQVKKEFSALNIIINGGVRTIQDIETHWRHTDGVMIGREAYHNPYFLAEIEHRLFNHPFKSREDVLYAFLPYVEKQLARGIPLHSMSRHILGLFAGQAGGKYWRRYLSENARIKNAGVDVLLSAFEEMKQHQ